MGIEVLIPAISSIVLALVGWAAKKGINYLDKKTSILDEDHELKKKWIVKQKILDAVQLATKFTMQTVVKEMKKSSVEGRVNNKLTTPQKSMALAKTMKKTVSLLCKENIVVDREVLETTIEALVNDIKTNVIIAVEP